MGSVADSLRTAKALISDPAKWIQNRYAQTAAGVECNPLHVNAVCYCAAGALRSATRSNPYGEDGIGDIAAILRCMEDALPKSIRSKYIAAYNDAPGRTHKQIMRWFDRAIALAERDEVKRHA